MSTQPQPFTRKPQRTELRYIYLPSQDKEREEEDEEVDSSHQFGFLQHPWPERSESRLFLALPLSDGLLSALSAQRALSTPPFCLWEVKSARQGQLCVLSYSLSQGLEQMCPVSVLTWSPKGFDKGGQ